MNKQQIIDYIEQNGGTEIPSLQIKFKLSYRQARGIVNEMTNDKRLKEAEGLWFASTTVRPVYNCFEPTPQADRTESDSARMERLRGEARQKRMEELVRTIIGEPEEEVQDWLNKAITADANLTLPQALSQARSELYRAQKTGNASIFSTYDSVVRFLASCSEETYDRLKKRVLKK